MSLSGDFDSKSLRTGTSGWANTIRRWGRNNGMRFKTCLGGRRSPLNNGHGSFDTEVEENMKNQDQNAGRMRGFRWKYFCQDGREETQNLLPLTEGEWAKPVDLGRKEGGLNQFLKLSLTI